MNKIRINGKEFELTNYYASVEGSRPAYVFNINASHDTIKPLALEANEIVIVSTIDDKSSERDLSSECVIFESILDKADNTCTLTMSNFSDIELLEQTIDDLLGV